MGVDKYNAACRGIVQRYSQDWKKTVRRVGRWVDIENAYFTMNVDFMESVWWVFKNLFDQGLIYEGYKVVPYSTGLSTVLSNFEANSNYKMVQGPCRHRELSADENVGREDRSAREGPDLDPRVDDDALDTAFEPCARGRERHRVRPGRRNSDGARSSSPRLRFGKTPLRLKP